MRFTLNPYLSNSQPARFTLTLLFLVGLALGYASVPESTFAQTEPASSRTQTKEISAIQSDLKATENSCQLPGITAVTDASGDALLASSDIQKISVAEPYFFDNSQKLVFTMKVAALGSNGLPTGLLSLPPLTSWIVFFKAPDNTNYYVEMRTPLTGSPQFSYGTAGNVLNILSPTLTPLGAAEQGLTKPDGTFQLTLDKGRVGNPTPGQQYAVVGGVYAVQLLGLVNLDSTVTGSYQLQGNSACFPYLNAHWGQNADVPVADDYNRNGATDFAVWRPDSGTWYVLDTVTGNIKVQQLGSGAAGDIPVPGDYDGDSKADFCVFRPSAGLWSIAQSSDGTIRTVQFGISEDIPVPGDFDGDHKDDIAVFRPSTASWYIQRSSDGTMVGTQFGLPEDRPVQGDYDGDGKDDIAVFRPSTGSWYILQSSNGVTRGAAFGVGTDQTVQGDYDGDGKFDLAVWRPTSGPGNEGYWFVLQSSDGAFIASQWGLSTDRPTPGDFNGNGRNDLAVWRPSTGNWYVLFN